MSDLVPEGWAVHRQGEICDFSNGRAYKLTEWEEEGTPVIRLQNLTGSGKNYYYSNLTLPDRQYCESGDLLYMWSATFGPHIWKGPKAIYHYHIWKVIPDEVNLTKSYSYQLLGYKTAEWMNSSNGMGILHVTKGGMENLPLILPPLPEQQKIAAILSSVDEVIEKTQAQINKLKDLKTGMMQELLSPREGQAANINNPQGESKNGLHHTEFKDSPLGRIPVGWEVVKTGDISKSIVPGRNKPKSLSGDIPWLTIADLDSFYVDKSKKNLGVTYENLREANGKTIPAKSVIMSVVGEFGISSVARCEMVINQQLHGFVCNEDIDPAFLCLSLRHHKLQQERLATQTTIAYMNKDNTESILFAKPPFSQQLKIAASILAVDEKINVLNSKHSSYINTKKALMQDLLTGKVRVTTDEV